MKPTFFNRFIFVILATVILGVFQVNAQTAKTVKTGSATSTVSENQKEAIENIVHDYLLKNPSIIREAMAALQIQEGQEKQQRSAENMKALKSEIYSDSDSPVVGNLKGDVTIVAFFDYNCGYCKKSLPSLQTLISKDSSIKIIYKELPIMGPQSQIAARAALAAGRQGKYAEFHNALIESDGTSNDVIKGISDKLGLNYATLQKDMQDPKINEALDRNLRLATSLEINGTPAYLIGEQFIPGAIDPVSLANIVSEERAKLANVTITQGNAESKK